MTASHTAFFVRVTVRNVLNPDHMWAVSFVDTVHASVSQSSAEINVDDFAISNKVAMGFDGFCA
jgi:hypothetical protein